MKLLLSRRSQCCSAAEQASNLLSKQLRHAATTLPLLRGLSRAATGNVHAVIHTKHCWSPGSEVPLHMRKRAWAGWAAILSQRLQADMFWRRYCRIWGKANLAPLEDVNDELLSACIHRLNSGPRRWHRDGPLELTRLMPLQL